MNHKLLASAALVGLLAGCGPQQEPAATAPGSAVAPAASPSATPAAGSASPQPAATASAADLSAGQAKYKTLCAGCHGPKAEGIATYPRLAGQSAEALAGKLAKYRAGEHVGPMSGTMMPIARMLTETEVKQVSAYLAAL
ncbi:MAG: c-type cytochrome [Pseudomonadota bacterium]